MASATSARCFSLADAIEDDAGNLHGGIMRRRNPAPRPPPTAPAARRRAPERPEARNARQDRRWRRAGPAAPAAPSNRPITPSMTNDIGSRRRLAPPERRAAARGMAQLSRLTLGATRPPRHETPGRCNPVRPWPRARRRRAAPTPPAPRASRWSCRRRSCGAAIMRPRAVICAPAWPALVRRRARARMVTMSPITTMAGGSNSCLRASPASFSNVDTSTRWRGVVAEAITAAGVAPASPASINAAAIRSRLCITM